ncbi:MAG TPA: long-chain fatty acid--CoA ligase [Solirubrobacteraceae bacterium]|nr:long-chain fatty acid--CoA ligase [Solirubrobacteraceae bacterium]
MEASATEPITGSRTIADLIARSAAEHPEHPAIRYKQDEAWHELNYTQLADVVEEVALGLIDLGVQPGERVCILANTRPEWSYADMAITATGAVVVPIYQTNSPEECQWVISDSGATAIVCEDSEQLAKLAAIREQTPALKTVIVIDPPQDESPLPAISLEQVRERGRGRPAAELVARQQAVKPEDSFTFIYTSGTTGPPKGCVLSHGNYQAMIDMIKEVGQIEDDEVIYLYLPLAHAFALLIQLAAFDLGATIAYFGGDTKQIVAELSEVKPTYLPSVPRIFEKIFTLANAALAAQPQEDQDNAQKAIALGTKVRDMQVRGETVPPELIAPFEEADEKLFKNVRAIFGGSVRHAVTGAAPIAKEILEFFWAAGIPVLEGYGMTESATAATVCTIEDHRFGTVGRPFPGVQIKIADDGEVLIKGPNVFQGYYKNADASFGSVEDGWLHTGDLGSLDEDGYLSITGRKKDIIITAGGKNITPANLENDLKQCRWISQAVMLGDKRPYPIVLVTLDEEEIGAFAQQHDLPADIASLCETEQAKAMVDEQVQHANRLYAQVEQVKRFAILPKDLSQETGELTPTLKVKRNVVAEKYAAVIDSLYTAR